MPKPKVISVFKTDSFENRFLSVSVIGKSVNLFVKCRCYELEIPVNAKTKKELNIFEETILRMIQLKQSSVSELADTLCMTNDLVNFLLIRLKDEGLLENNQMLSEKGKEILNLQRTIRNEVQYIQGKLFMIEKTGMVLPYIHIGEFQSEAVEEFDGNTITLGFGSAGNRIKIKGSYLHSKYSDKKCESTLETRKIRKAIKTYNKLALTRKMTKIDLSEGYAFNSSAGELVFFHLQAVIQQGNVDEIVFSDGIVPNIDGMLEYIRTEDSKLLNLIKSKAVDMNVAEKGKNGKNIVSGKYFEIYQRYKNAGEHVVNLKAEQNSLDEIKRANEAKKQIVIDCYYMIEWGFYYYTLKSPLSEPIFNLLKKRGAAANEKTLVQFAADIGIQNIKGCINLFSHVEGKKISGVYSYKSPKLYICLPLAVAEAKENSGSTIHKLIRKDSGFLRFINELNINCGDLRHNTEADVKDLDVGKTLEQTLKILATLLPDLMFGESDSPPERQNDISMQRLRAQVVLEKQLGTICFSSMAAGLQNDWIKISPDKKGIQLPDYREYIEILYRILQTELAEANEELEGKSQLSQEDAVNFLKKRHDGLVPESFTTILGRNYIKATKGEKSTLGAEALVYIANVDENLAKELEGAHFVSILDKVMKLRGHGDMLVLNETEESLNTLRDGVIQLSKIIGGYHG